MVTKRVFIVFVLPIIFSMVFGSAVLFDVLQTPGRELNMLPMSYSEGGSSHKSEIEIIGLDKQYSTSKPVEIQVKVDDFSFRCGDLYITIYSSGKSVVTQGGFFEQCFEPENGIIPVEDTFSEVITTPGSYEIVIEMVSKQLKTTSAKGTFIVK